jgi:serine protease AprX
MGGKVGLRLDSVNGLVVELPNSVLRAIAHHPAVERIVWDRPLEGSMSLVATTVGARAVLASYGYTGAGIGVAVIDSGVTSWHDDLTYHGSSDKVLQDRGQRVAAFVDFVGGRTAPYDDYGHGTHVAGIIAGNGGSSASGARAGIAQDAHLVSLKVLDGDGQGVISNVIAALDWAVAHKAAYNIRVINLSVGAAVTESYKTDPLALAAKRAVDAGIVVVAAAGNLGANEFGEPMYGGITAPGNAPWVLTVGAYSTQGTVTRADDVMASYSSRGPTAIDFQAKPDLVAPGTGVVSLAEPTSHLYSSYPAYLVDGALPLASKPYLCLSGTSMAAPVVSGTIALMLQANPNLTPNLVKAVLQYTSQTYPGYDTLTQGAGFINSKGAVDLVRFFRTATPGDHFPSSDEWSRNIIWANYRLSAGMIKPNATAWHPGVDWGAATDLSANNIVWGTVCPGSDCDNLLWSAADAVSTAPVTATNIVWGTVVTPSNIVWGTALTARNIVWGTACGGADCPNVLWGSGVEATNVVWGTALAPRNIVWGTALAPRNIVWGTALAPRNIVWGTALAPRNIVWGTALAPTNIVWGTSVEPVIGATSAPPVASPPRDDDELFGPGYSTAVKTLTGVMGGL